MCHTVLIPMHATSTSLLLHPTLLTPFPYYQRTLYGGVFDCFKKVYASHGVSGFYRGLLSPLIGSMAENALSLSSYQYLRRTFTALSGQKDDDDGDPAEDGNVCWHLIIMSRLILLFLVCIISRLHDDRP